VAPAALAGYALGDQIERRFGTPGTIATGLLAGSIAMAVGDLRKGTRLTAAADMNDGLALGLAQAVALIPGVSRSGATIAAARARGFSRIDADRLSWQVGLPVIAGAALLKGTRLVREGVPRELRAPLIAGAASAFASTLLSARLLGPRQRAVLLPASTMYRGVLAGLVVRRMRDNTT
jgi:undecaprenyl-diphosphatase